MNAVWDVVGSVIPPLFIGLLFWFIMRAILRADSKEREVYSKIEAEERAKFEAKNPTKKG
jgi:flagellar biosynthesis/type III secretory pathway M-ring protein FliF/YscJ